MSGLRSATALVLALSLVTPGGVAATNDAGDADPAPRATLKWTSKNDEGLYGYLVYRAETREGPFRRINREIVRLTAADQDGIAKYAYVDTDVVPGHTYYYYLDTLGRNGRKRRFSGVVAKTVAER